MGNKSHAVSETSSLLVSGAGINLAGKIIGRAFHFLSQLLLARWLGPFLFGLYAIGWNSTRVLSLLASLGLDSGVIHRGMRYWGENKKKLSEIIVGALSISLLAGAILGVITFLAAPAAADWFDKPELTGVFRLFAVLPALMAGVKVGAAATRITKEMLAANLVEEITQPGIHLLLISGAVFLGSGLEGYILAAVLSFGMSLVAAMAFLNKMLIVRPDPIRGLRSSGRDLLDYSVPIAGPVVLGSVVMMLDRILVGYYLPEEQAGIYQAVAITSALFIAVLSAFKTILAPLTAELHHRDDQRGLKRLIQSSTRWVFVLCLPFLLVLLISPESFLVTLFGEAYRSGASVLMIITAAQMVNMGAGAVDQFLIMTGNQRSWLKASVVVFLTSAVLFPILIPRWGLAGAAAVNVWVFSGLSISGVYLVVNRVGVVPFHAGTIKTAAAAVLTAGGMLLVRKFLPGEGIRLLALQATTAVVIFYPLLILMGLDEADRELINLLRARIGL
jgi:O-antigen/teichoic acid export membrane protein